MFNEGNPIIIDNFKGLYSRPGSSGTTPRDHALACNNYDFGDTSLLTRADFRLNQTLAAAPIYIEQFIRSDDLTTNPGYIYIDASGRMYYTKATVPATPIHTFASGSVFSMVSIADRAYITPHNYNQGLPGEFLYVYYFSAVTGAWVFRQAGGVRPVIGPMGAFDGAAGVVSAGKHVIRIAFEYETGFISRLSDGLVYTAPGGKTIDLFNIPGGGTGVVAVHIIVSPFLGTAWDGNPDNAEAFFLTRVPVFTPWPNFNLNGANTLNFYDSQLLNSAESLFDVLDTIPAAMGLSLYANRLVLGGMTPVTVGTVTTYPFGTLLISDTLNYETFDSIDGLYRVNPADGGSRAIACHEEYRGTLIISKRGKTYGVQDPLDGTQPVDWQQPTLIDGAMGSDAVNGFAKMDAGETSVHKESLFIADWSGLQLFQGAYVNPEFPLTWKIESIWTNIPKTDFKKIQVRIQPALQKIFILIPNQTTSQPFQLLVGDYSNGLDYQNIKWTNYFNSQFTYNAFSSILVEALNNNASDTRGLLVTYPNNTVLHRQISYATSVGSDDSVSPQDAVIGIQYTSDIIVPSPEMLTCHLVGARLFLVCGNDSLPAQISLFVEGTREGVPSVTTLQGTISTTAIFDGIKSFNGDCNLQSFVYTLVGTSISKIRKIVIFIQDLAEAEPM